MLDLPTSDILDFVLYRAPDTTYIEVFIFPSELSVTDTFDNYSNGHFLTPEQEMSIDSYLIDYGELEDYGIVNRDALLEWLKNIKISGEKASKIVDAIFCWNLVYVVLGDQRDDVDAFVPKHQKHPILTEPSKRDIKVTQEDKSKVEDMFDPFLHHINRLPTSYRPNK